MKKTLFHSLTFPPDTISTGMIVSEIADGINKKLNNVEVLASSPQYNMATADSLDISEENLIEGSYKNIKVNYIKSKPRKFSNISRFFQWIEFNIKSILFIYKNRSQYDNIFIFSYPPTMNLVCIFTSKVLKINTVYSLWELYPEVAEKLNEEPNRILKLFFKLLDNYALKNVNKVVVNSNDLKKYLISKRNIIARKIHVVNHFSPFIESDYKPNFELNNIFYAGNTGRPQNLSVFLNYFKKNFPNDWQLDIFGAGQEFDNLSEFSNHNIRVNNYLDRKELENITKDIPFALISLDYEITFEAFPGKTFDYLNMNKVLINFSNPNSVVSKLIDDYGLGFNIDLNKPESLERKLKDMKCHDEISKIKKNIKYFQKNVSNKEIAIKSYLELISPSS
ncbi:MAG: hypothetical protein CL971_05870 [Euryarchaeota archaeon]|nr:hypothetical protein [Euryarchaeota archaeon]